MWFRSAVYRVLFPAAVVLPLWVFIMRGVIGADSAGDAFAALVLTPVLFVLLLVTSGLTVARRSVRQSRAVSWLDAAVFTALVVDLAAYGILHWTLLAVLSVLLVIGQFWLVTRELLNETRARVNDLIGGEYATQGAGPRRPAGTPSSRIPPASGQTIIIKPND